MSLAHDLAAAALARLDPEQAHGLTLAALAAGLGPGPPPAPDPIVRTTLAGLALASPIGLAAGFDKNAQAADAMLRAGFGFVECGTVTPRPQSGNPKPRLFRLREDRAVINRLGFNNQGLDRFVARLSARAGRPGVVGANVGANKDSLDRAGDYLIGVSAVWPVAAYVTINISSPNTPGLRGLQERAALEDLLGRVTAARPALTAAHGPRPVFLKVAPDLDETAIGAIADVARAAGLDALIVSNTMLARPEGLTSRHRGEAGGLSGAPLLAPSTAVLRLFRQALGGAMPLIGVGGVASGADAYAKIRAGAHAVQLYSALVYEGPGLAARIARDLARRLRADGFASVAEAVGAG